MTNRTTRYAQVGLGLRSWIFTLAMLERRDQGAELVALCELNPGRLADRLQWARRNGLAVNGYGADEFEQMISEQRPDCVIVTTPDHLHADYICRALERGCDVISEKPLTIDASSLQRILDVQRSSGRNIRVAFNYRYSPPRAQVKQLIADGAIGDVLSVDFHWLLDTAHGADYFRRWHRRKANSGGLLVHKATHHFDLLNWWLGSVPTFVQASGHRRYYTPANADALGLAGRSDRCLDCSVAGRCSFRLDLQSEKLLSRTYLAHEEHDGYFRDRCVFSDEIDIEDTMNLLVDYRSGTRMSYSLNAFMPREGYSVSFNGSRGRLDHVCRESSYVSGSTGIPGVTDALETTIVLQRQFERAQDIPIESDAGSHGGGDRLLIEDLFDASGDEPDALDRRADHRAGAWSILTGIAANLSIETGTRVAVDSLALGLPLP